VYCRQVEKVSLLSTAAEAQTFEADSNMDFLFSGICFLMGNFSYSDFSL